MITSNVLAVDRRIPVVDSAFGVSVGRAFKDDTGCRTKFNESILYYFKVFVIL